MNENYIIKCLNDLRDKNIPDAFIQKVNDRYSSSDSNYKGELTDIQKKAFSTVSFWNPTTNIIIQGSTSAGKTLTAEVAAAFYREFGGLKSQIIYLVPLRAMVSEIRYTFVHDFGESVGWTVYASSSDFQDHDEDILAGEFDIAIIVYEKFFALLAQPDYMTFVKGCKLLVIDELQMLSDEGRGIKLETALTKFRQTNSTCKIMGLTTTNNSVEKVKVWLNAELIESTNRPKPLHEYVISPDGHYRLLKLDENGNLINDNDDNGVLFEPDEIYTSEEDFVIPLIRHLVNENKANGISTKIIVFINNVNKTMKLAVKIYESIDFPKRSPNTDLTIKMLLQDDENSANLLISKLFPHGIAFHNGKLPRAIRDIVEEEFRKSDGIINIVVATETLAIGLNMPADIVILVNNKLPKGSNKDNEMNSQEYKNFIGRAGRYGSSAARIGRSFIIAENPAIKEDFWNRYVNAPCVPIESMLVHLKVEEQAPYVLNWIRQGNKSFNLETLKDSLLNSFAYHNYSNAEKIVIIGNEIIRILKSSYLIEDDLFTPNQCVYSKFGEKLAAFALELKSMSILKDSLMKMLSQYITEQELSIEIIARNVTEQCLLDILFFVCNTSELQAKFSKDDNEVNESIFTYLNKKKHLIIKGWPIDTLRSKKSWPIAEIAYALKQTILVYEWISGSDIDTIKRNTGFTDISIGDISRFGETCAFILEAISQLCESYKPELNDEIENTKFNLGKVFNLLRKSFYHCSGFVKYGLPNKDLVLLASRHVYNVSRKKLMMLDEEARQLGMNVVRYVMNPAKIEKTNALNKEQILLMREALDNQMLYKQSRERKDSLEYYRKAILSLKRKNMDIISDSEADTLLKMLDEAFELSFINKLFVNRADFYIKDDSFDCIRLLSAGKELRICILTSDKIIQADQVAQYSTRFKDSCNIHTLLLSALGFSFEALNRDFGENIKLLSARNFAKLFIQSLLESAGLELLINALVDKNDLCKGSTKFDGYLANYQPPAEVQIGLTGSDIHIKIYIVNDERTINSKALNAFTSELHEAKLEYNIRAERVRWGDNGEDYDSYMLNENTFVVLFVDENLLSSCNRIGTIIHVLQQRFENSNIFTRVLPLYLSDKIRDEFVIKYPKYILCEGLTLNEKTMLFSEPVEKLSALIKGVQL